MLLLHFCNYISPQFSYNEKDIAAENINYNNLFATELKAYQTIESDDRNKILPTTKISLFDDSKVSSIDGELAASNSDHDLKNILHMLHDK